MCRAVIIAATAIVTTPATADAMLEYGEYLAGECMACHQLDTPVAGIPALSDLPTEAFSAALYAYRSKDRDHPAMQVIASRLKDADIAALAAYFDGLAKGPARGRDKK